MMTAGRSGGLERWFPCQPVLPVDYSANHGRCSEANAYTSLVALSHRLAAAPPMPSSLAPARCSEATPDELEEWLRFFARQIKSFRRTSLLYSSSELRERIQQMEEDYETAVSKFYCRQPPSSSALQSGAAAQSKPGLQRGAAEQPTPGLQGAATEQPTAGLQGAAAARPTPGPQRAAAAARPTPGPQSAAIVRPKSASTSSTRPTGRRKRDASAQVIGGLGDASVPAHATEGLGDASTPALGLKAFQGISKRMVLVLIPEPCDEGFEDEPPPDPVPERFEKELVLVFASEPRDEGFEEEAPPDPVSEGFTEQLVLVLASEGPPDSASVSEGPVGDASAYEGSAGTVKAKPDSKPDSKPPEFHRVSGGSSTLLGRPPDQGSSSLLGQPPDHQFFRRRPPQSGDVLVAHLNFVLVFVGVL
ncbi:hypothetical protein CRENBAI_002723 [Crenichthys baileyi]|uniref:Uncharacterized protein n=1 Tax=Crenichthys baileyi TaxID=28760 RepID=A0AAV9RH10_9TELE